MSSPLALRHLRLVSCAGYRSSGLAHVQCERAAVEQADSDAAQLRVLLPLRQVTIIALVGALGPAEGAGEMRHLPWRETGWAIAFLAALALLYGGSYYAALQHGTF